MNLEWFRKELGGRRTFDGLNRLAGDVPATDDCPMFIPHLDGRVSPGWPDMRGAWAGLTRSHTAGHMYRAMLEGVALEYRVYKEVLLTTYPGLRVRELRVTGGGEKSEVWNRIKADVLGCRVVRIAASEGAPMGSALLAGFGVGIFRSPGAAAAAWVKAGRVTKPDRRLSKYYGRRYRRYVSLLNRTNEWSGE